MTRDYSSRYYSFNARYLSLTEVAKSFVFNPQFGDLTKNNHSLLMGPRGSGKTTMLKMLTPLAMSVWKGKKSNEIRDSVPFWGVYIPTDVQWKTQISHFQKELMKFPNYSKAVSKLIVSTNILIAFCETFKQILSILDYSRDPNLVSLEVKFCKELIVLWDLKLPLSPDISSVTRAVQSRLAIINSHVDKTKYTIKNEDDIIYPDFFFQDYLSLAEVACSAFEDIYKDSDQFKDKPFRWALCFDELEIAPSWLQKELLNYLRSTYQRFIFKLTTSPLVSLYDAITNEGYSIDAQLDNDYKIIRIWTSSQNDYKLWSKFCDELVTQKIKTISADIEKPYNLFGNDKLQRSIIETITKRNNYKIDVKQYSRDSVMWFVQKELAKKDASFKKFLEGKDIIPDDPIPVKVGQQDSIFRKIKPIVIHRYHLNKEGGKKSISIYPLFYGLPYIYELAEGNPRALIGLLDDFISNIRRDEYGNVKAFEVREQSRILRDFSERMLKIISAHPDSHVKITGVKKMLSLGLILNRIGEFFSDKINYDDFSMDPYGCFIVDENVSEYIVNLLKLGLDLGAIVYLDPSEGISENGIIGKKFKLSYLLYPMFKLPKQEFNSINLSKIIGDKYTVTNQLTLFE